MLNSILQGIVLGGVGALVGAGILGALNMANPFMGNILLSLLYIVLAGVPAVLVTFGAAMALHLEGVQHFANILNRVIARFKR